MSHSSIFELKFLNDENIPSIYCLCLSKLRCLKLKRLLFFMLNIRPLWKNSPCDILHSFLIYDLLKLLFGEHFFFPRMFIIFTTFLFYILFYFRLFISNVLRKYFTFITKQNKYYYNKHKIIDKKNEL